MKFVYALWFLLIFFLFGLSAWLLATKSDNWGWFFFAGVVTLLGTEIKGK